jgi:hypothetical protein
MLIEILIASCIYEQTYSTQMKCHYKNSIWISKSHVTKFYPDDGNHYVGKTCWLQEDDEARTLMAESCEDFSKRFNQ